METSTLIIGGGLSGLALAEALEWRGQDYVIVDARERFGGRISTVGHGDARFDMGPAWFWPGQPRIAALIDRLGLTAFPQFATGAQIYEDASRTIQRGRGLASMEGSWRLAGGLTALTDALGGRLPDWRKRLGTKVTGLSQWEGKVAATFANGTILQAKRVVLAMPPRLAAGSLTFSPRLPDDTRTAMEAVPTWMAGQAKAMAIYETPFWREAGLSGDVMSRAGPMVELHDASPADKSHGALFGFIGVPPGSRHDVPRLRQNVIAQLGRLFGPEGAAPLALNIKDWAFDPLTSTPKDAAGPTAHPTYGLTAPMRQIWGNRIILSGSETAPQFGGYLEGALEAAEIALHTLTARPSQTSGQRRRA